MILFNIAAIALAQPEWRAWVTISGAVVWWLGHIQSRVVYYLMNIHVLPRTIYVARVSDV